MQLLADEFLTRLNEGVTQREIMAEVVKADAGHDEVITGGDVNGLATKAGSLPRSIAWTSVEPKAVLKLFKKFTSQRVVENNVFLAALCQEMGLEKQSKMFRETAELVDSTGTAKEQLKPYFPD